MKNFLIALVIAIVIVNCLGSVMHDFLGIHLNMANESLDMWEAMALLTTVGVVIVVVGFVVAVSVIGTLFLTLGAAFLALLALGVGAFWPIIVLALLIYAFKDKKRPNSRINQPL